MKNYDVIIGLEIHLQFKTKSKMFCSCSAEYFENDPNTQACPLCLGMPGTLPVPNKKAIEYCILMGLATDCEIADQVKFDRKHYFYPDLPKGYQISQYDEPLCYDGKVKVRYLDEKKNWVESVVELERIHQEEDVAKSMHRVDPQTGQDFTLIDYNKSGVPLMEIVTKPVIKDPKEARAYAERIRQIGRYLGISDADMEKGQMRCEPNISLQRKGDWKYEDGKILPVGEKELNPKVEVKNIGSISAVEASLNYEIERQYKAIEKGGKLVQQTRGWNADKGVTEYQRSKETAEDYRYFDEPDIPRIRVTEEVKKHINTMKPELPSEKEDRYKKEFALSDYDISILTAEFDIANNYEKVLEIYQDKSNIDIEESAKEIVNWFSSTLFPALNDRGVSIKEIDVNWEEFIDVIDKVVVGKYNGSKAREVVKEALAKGKDLGDAVDKADLEVMGDSDELLGIVKKIVEENKKAVNDYKDGKESVIGFLVGQVMKASKGKADPNLARELLKDELS